MSDGLADRTGLDDEDRAFDALQDLERQPSDEIRRLRAHDRMAVKASVVIQPGNSSDTLNFKYQGVTGDISEGGCRIMLPMPLYVGDVFRLTFDHPQLDLPMVFARCMRCRLIREEAFEAGFKFFTPVNVSSNAVAQESQLLI